MRLPTLVHNPTGNVAAFAGSEGDDARTAATLLEYAADSLTPDAEILARMGGVVRAAFLESPLGSREAVATQTESGAAFGPRGLNRLLWGRGRRRTFASLCAVAVLTLTSASFVGAESNPGQPFYRIRLSLEAVRVPFQQPADPLQSKLDTADARLAEAEREAAVKDWNAAADATGAYADVITSISLPTTDTAAAAAASQRLGAELTRLEHLRLTSGAPETVVLDKAIAAVCRLLGLPVPTPPTSATPAVPGATDSDGRPGDRATSTPAKGRDRDGSGGPAGVPKTTPEPAKSRSPGRSNDPDAGHATPTQQDTAPVGHSFGGGPRR
jgi:hypothetical protein